MLGLNLLTSDKGKGSFSASIPGAVIQRNMVYCLQTQVIFNGSAKKQTCDKNQHFLHIISSGLRHLLTKVS